ncbi:TMEM175 family protein [Methylosinus sp. PW1]|uniref:TMEM175 family protein n=1 Tax=Methylosinus sp. PW1 TaxID=107636 RepID=UPI0018DE844C|nr:TMEM175 family protein [Methylosinus sp. PW1]
MQDDKETTRIETFSDGVFAIVITLLVLEIKLPSHEAVAERGLARSLGAAWPSYLGFLISFVTILAIWAHHHWIFTTIRRADHPLVYWNGLLLMVVTLVPFSTGLLAEYLLHPEAQVAANAYTGNFFAISLAFHGLWRHISTSGRLRAPQAIAPTEDAAARLTKHYRLGPMLYLGAFMASFVSEAASVSACLLLAFFFALGGWPTDSRN